MTDLRRRGDGTRVVHAGLPDAVDGQPFLPGPTFAAPFHASGDPLDSPYVYGRYDNPTWSAYEQALAELEGGRAVAFASGMAAVAAILLPRLRPGDVLVAPSDCYMSVRTLARGHLAERGVEVRLVPTAGDAVLGALEGARIVWIESPSNPRLDVADLERTIDRAHAAGALVAVDNTLATPLGQQPLALGADFSMASDSKHVSGHGDLILGHVAVRDPAHADELLAWRIETGAIPGPFEIWLAHRSIATLDVRLERACANALAIAELLGARDDVTAVRYPGLPSDPGYPVATRQMSRFGTVVSFELAGEQTANEFLAACELIAEATSFGGVHSSAERRARWKADDIAPGFIRLSAGCENTDDLLADIAAALDRAAAV
ncbi:MAG: cystathionine gamma-lyase [Thermoleophilaceae bacterium]|nr:cystathionine gamma-lyase [Thermoleophilaceae bacterium]